MTLAEFLREQAERMQAEAPQRDKMLAEWQQAVERLIGQMKEWPREADREKVLRAERV